MKSYDYIIAGGGCAGLSLAYYLSQSTLANASVLIIDRDDKTQNDRTWCFWTSKPTAFDEIVSKEWNALTFADPTGTQHHRLSHRSYKLIRSADFYQFTKAAIQQYPNFHWLKANVSDVVEDEDGPYVIAEGIQYRAKWVFNSCFNWRNWQRESENNHFLLQHFRGWLIESKTPAFDPKRATLMDFRTKQHGNARFLYVLPFSATKALVEYTIFSASLEPHEQYEQVLRDHLQHQLQVADYEILETEQGVIPMTDMPMAERASQKIIDIGTPGGAVKPTTGYAFLRIQQQTQQIVKQLVKTGSPSRSSLSPERFRFYDKLLLDILENDGAQAQPIFSRLFRNNDVNTILTFLDEGTNIAQEARIFTSLPLPPFLRALARVYGWRAKSKTMPMLQPIIERRFK